jgi:hypothetical protein
MRVGIHDGQEHKRSIHGPDTEAQDPSSPFVTSSLQRTTAPKQIGQLCHVERSIDEFAPDSGVLLVRTLQSFYSSVASSRVTAARG